MLEQYITNGIILGSSYAIVGLSFFIIYKTTKFFNFAHAGIFTLGPYITFFFIHYLNFSIILSSCLSIIFCSFLGLLLYIYIFQIFFNKVASTQILLLVSLGVYIFLQNFVSLVFTDNAKSINSLKIYNNFKILGAYITFQQLVLVSISIMIFLIFIVAQNKNKGIKLFSVVGGNSKLAISYGVHTNMVYISSFILGSALASLSGILISLDINMTPTMGLNTLLMGIIAIIIVGINTSYLGILIGGIILGLLQSFGTIFLKAQWQNSIAFFILIIVFLIRPQGFFGKPLKKAEM